MSELRSNDLRTPQAIAADIARELREHPDHWFQGGLVRFTNGKVADEADYAGCSDAVCWCLEGHIVKRTGVHLDDGTMQAFQEAIGEDELYKWNDSSGRTVQDVIAACDAVAHGTALDVPK